MGHVVVIGGGVGGLGAAIGFARRGWTVTVVERDEAPTTDDGEAAFLTWERPGVPQFRLPHGFSARSRRLLLEHAPDVVERLRADGIEEFNLFKMLAPREIWEAGDDCFTGLRTRRPAFELALRRTAEAEPGVELRSPAAVSGLRYARAVDGTLTVTGVDLDGGGSLPADIVLDCGGRRTPVLRWLRAAGVLVPEEEQDCDSTYYSRYYRLRPESGLQSMMVIGVRGETESFFYAGLPGDKGTVALVLAVPPREKDLRALRHNDVWEAVAGALPAVKPWIDPVNALPVHDVQVMAGHKNTRRQHVVDGRPLVLGLLAVGDSMCTTNPMYGWGASMALTYAFAAVDAVTSHPGDLPAAALAYDDAVREEADGVYRESAAMDRARIYRMSGAAVPESDRAEMERQDLISRGVAGGVLTDPVLARAFLRRVNLVDRPDAILDDPEVVDRARAVRDAVASRPPEGPSRAELQRIVASVRGEAAALAGA